MIPLIKVVRPVNLLIIALTMYSIAWYFDTLIGLSGWDGEMLGFPFFLLVLSTLLIAAAGNIINDYFDQKADRVNRPKRVIVGREIKRRTAIFYHWVFNLIAFLLAVYLSWLFQSFWYLFIHLLSINLLWFYSMYLKRTSVAGNVSIAFLTALVPILVGIFYNQTIERGTLIDYFPMVFVELSDYPIWMTMSLGVFAFALNWSREVVKDIQDIEGDRKLRARTLPIVKGIKFAKIISLLILLLPILLFGLAFFLWYENHIRSEVAFFPLIFAAIILFVSIAMVSAANTPDQFKRAHLAIKVTMIFGLLLPLFWAFLMW